MAIDFHYFLNNFLSDENGYIGMINVIASVCDEGGLCIMFKLYVGEGVGSAFSSIFIDICIFSVPRYW